MVSKGFGSKNIAEDLLRDAIKEYKLIDTMHNTK